MSAIAKRIEDFAIEMLLTVKTDDATERTDADGSKAESQKVLIYALLMWGFTVLLTWFGELTSNYFFSQDSDSEKHSNEPPAVSGNQDISSDTHQSCNSQSVSSLSIAEAERCLSLYFALCTKVWFYLNI